MNKVTTTTSTSEHFMRATDVAKMVGVSRRQLYILVKNGFPEPRFVGPQSPRWFYSDVINWMRDCPAFEGINNLKGLTDEQSS